MSDVPVNEDAIVQLLQSFDGDTAKMTSGKTKYPLLLTQTKGPAHVHPDHHHLLFNRVDEREFTDQELTFLLGSKWATIKERYLSRPADAKLTLEKDGGHVDMLNLDPSKHMSQSGEFDILGRGRGVLAYDETNSSAEIPAMVILALSLTLLACRLWSRGLFLWQAKLQSATDDAWRRVPDILYLDHVWLPEERERFLNRAGYREQREFLNADLRLHEHDVVLPFVVDFTGRQYGDSHDARVTASINGVGAPKAAISIPGAAYIGWFSDMVPRESSTNKARFYSAASQRAGAQWLLSPTQKTATRCLDLKTMCIRARDMYRSPQKGALVFYSDVRELCRAARSVSRKTTTEDQHGRATMVEEEIGDEEEIETEENEMLTGDE